MMTEYPGAVKSRLYEAIAEKHGVTACAVRYVLVRAGLEVTKSKKNVEVCTPKTIRMITATEPQVTLNGRYSTTETAAALGVSSRTIHRWTEAGMMRCGYRRCNGKRFYFGSEIIRIWQAKY